MSTPCGMDFAIHGKTKGETIMSLLNDLKNLDADTILGALGVQRKRTADWIAPAVGGLVVGAMVGAVVALLFTRTSGGERRQDLARRVDKVLHPSPSASPSPSISPEAAGQFRRGSRPAYSALRRRKADKKAAKADATTEQPQFRRGPRGARFETAESSAPRRAPRPR